MEKEKIIFLIFSGTAFVVLVSAYICFSVLLFFRQKRRLLLELQTTELKFQQELVTAQYEMQEHVFRIIGQEIHDNVGQLLTVAKINLNILSMEMHTLPRVLDVKKQVGQALDELRYLSNSYNSDTLIAAGLQPAIKMQFEQLQKTGLFAVSYQSKNADVSLPANKTIFLYRMVQEVLNNAVKHSGATELSARLFSKENELHIIIHDNGKGFNNEGKYKEGIGFQNIWQRAEMIETKVAIHSQPGEGTTVHFICKHNGYD